MIVINARQLTPLGIEVKKKLIDLGMTQKEFCKTYGIPESRFSEILYGARPGVKYKQIIANILDMREEPK